MKKNGIVKMIGTITLIVTVSIQWVSGQMGEMDENGVPVELYPPGYADSSPTESGNTSVLSESLMTNQTAKGMGGVNYSYEPQNLYQLTDRKYQMINLGTLPGGTRSAAYAINNKGQIVGYSWTNSTGGHYCAFIYKNGVMRRIGNSELSEALGINNDEQIVGRAYLNSHIQAFRYLNGQMQDLGVLPDLEQSIATGVNDEGVIVGQYSQNFVPGSQAFIYSNSIMSSLGTLGGNTSGAQDINNKGLVVGYSTLGDNVTIHAFLYDGNSMQDLGTLGGDYSSALAINENDQIVGTAKNSNQKSRAFCYYGGIMQDLGTLGGTSSVAEGINNFGDIVGYSTLPSSSSPHAFIYSGSVMKNLSDLVIAFPEEWDLQYAYGINDEGQIVGDYLNRASGQHYGFLLNPIPAGALEAIETQPLSKTYGICPTKEPGKDSLVLVTHGWQSFPVVPDVSWVDNMSNAITSTLASLGKTNYQVYGYKWVDNAWTVSSMDALYNAKQEGANLGSCLAIQQWSHVHLIAHSAGANLIQEASEWIKAVSPTTTVHCTFLDAFVGNDRAGVSNYGRGTDWSDSYFSRDVTGSVTEALLDYAYNVDVTQLGPKYGVTKFRSQETGEIEVCTRTRASHAWPHEFYLNSITGNTNLAYGIFGFPLSMEYGGWDYAITNYTMGSQINLGDPDPICASDINVEAPPWFNSLFNFPQSQTAWKSTTGNIQQGIGSIKMDPGSPVWISKFVNPTNVVNFVSFDMEFISTNSMSGGLLSVYWDAEMIGSIDERVVRPDLQHYLFTFPNVTADSVHILGFRLDPFTNASSSVILTNVTIGQTGISQPFSLRATTNTVGGLMVWELLGQSGFEYDVQVSTNLIDWTDIAILENTNGIVRFFDQSSTNSSQRFYRAVVPR